MSRPTTRIDDLVPAEFAIPCETLTFRSLPLDCFRFPDSIVDSSRALVCIPGFAAGGRSFARLRPLSTRFDVRMISIPCETTYPGDTIEALAGITADLIATLDRPVLLGTSFGGLVAIRVAAMLGERISGLVLIAAFPGGRFLPTAGGLTALPLVQYLSPLLAPVTTRFVGGRLDRSALRAVIVEARSIPASERSRRLQTIFATDFSPLLPSISVPALVIHGTRDRLVPRSAARALAGGLPNATYREMVKAAHLPHVTHAGEIIGILRPFLEEVLTPGGATEVTSDV
ncbi:MAG TPA: alpha/beta hydrolase [Thermoanaerobaculia bacterium]|nr:alpha/beta hydrolase [Thermoanaerobaculia bacterium]